MKGTIILLCTVVSLGYCNFIFAEIRSGISPVGKNCQTESNVNQEDITEARNGIFDYSKTNLTCYLKCVFLNIPKLKADDLPEKLSKFFSPKLMARMKSGIGICGTMDMNDDCSKGMKIFECIYKHYRNFFFIP